MLLGWNSAAWATAPATLTTLRAIHDLSNGEGDKHYPVALEATVTYYRWAVYSFFVQDGDAAVFVVTGKDAHLVPGDRVLIKGTTDGSFRPIIRAVEIVLLGRGSLPEPVQATFDDFTGGWYDCRLVTVHAVVHAADEAVDTVSHQQNIRLWLVTDGGRFEADLDSDDPSLHESLLDAEVEITGVLAGRFDDKMQMTGIVLFVHSLSQMKILRYANANPWSLPVTPMDRIITGYHVDIRSKRLLVRGVITYFQPGLVAVLQDGNRSIWVTTHTHAPLKIGDLADATGFADIRGRSLSLTDGEIQDSHKQASIIPFRATWQQLAFWGSNTPDGHQNDLVSIEGVVVAEVREATQDDYVLTADSQLFTAIYRHLRTTSDLPPMKMVPLGSRVRLTGICTRTETESVVGTATEVPFEILLRSTDDIAVVANPSWLSIRNLIMLVGLLLAIVAIVGFRGWTLERKVRQKTVALARSVEAEAALERRSALLEQRRSRILEDINGSRPLSEVLEQTLDMVSFMLCGASCWCQVLDGTIIGKCPPNPEQMRVIHEEITARSGPALGKLFAAFDPESIATITEIQALTVGTRLATLAFETRRLYSDLRRRSEFDLLTDVPNRFAMEKFIDLRIEQARGSGEILGLIYIDLDKFKPINDKYGHHVGDLYLQAVAGRMSNQLLGSDMLARLGGDEFAALVTLPRGRPDLDRILSRLEQCFMTPFHIEGITLHGEASFGVAIFPQDGETRDRLLIAADAAMYEAKKQKASHGKRSL
jgi:diguanylate cyclase (GGDEF)-like protein